MLEVAAGTGVVTRALASALPRSVAIVATDLNQAMLDQAAAVGTARPWSGVRPTRCGCLSPTAAFDAVVCQFGVMFFPDKAEGICGGAPRPRGREAFSCSTCGTGSRKTNSPTGDDARSRRCFPRTRRASSRARRTAITTAAPSSGIWPTADSAPAAHRHGRGAQPRGLAAHPGDRVLPGHAAQERDRGSRRRPARRGDRRRSRGDRPAVRTRERGRQDPGTHRDGRALSRIDKLHKLSLREAAQRIRDGALTPRS